jgi:hypothetical protein
MINGMRAAQARYVQVNAEIFRVIAVTMARPNLRTNSHNKFVRNLINRHGDFHETLSRVPFADCVPL